MTKKILLFKDLTYYSLIKEAIYSTRNLQATASDIFNYCLEKFPSFFKESNSMTWKGNIRQVLSKHPEFVKNRKFNSKKEHFWTHRSLVSLKEEENRKYLSLLLETDSLNIIKNKGEGIEKIKNKKEDLSNEDKENDSENCNDLFY